MLDDNAVGEGEGTSGSMWGSDSDPGIAVERLPTRISRVSDLLISLGVSVGLVAGVGSADSAVRVGSNTSSIGAEHAGGRDPSNVATLTSLTAVEIASLANAGADSKDRPSPLVKNPETTTRSTRDNTNCFVPDAEAQLKALRMLEVCERPNRRWPFIGG